MALIVKQEPTETLENDKMKGRKAYNVTADNTIEAFSVMISVWISTPLVRALACSKNPLSSSRTNPFKILYAIASL